MQSQSLDQILEEVQFACFGGASADAVAPMMRRLAQAQYRPALDFFLTCLRDRRLEWRVQSLMLLGGHYDLLGHQAALEALRGVLRQDEDVQLRRKAAELLSLFSEWPDQGLIDALQQDPHVDVRFGAMQASLELLGVPRMRVRDEIGMMRANHQLPTMADVSRISQSSRPSPGSLF